jgi:hypothetical protein
METRISSTARAFITHGTQIARRGRERIRKLCKGRG